METKKIKVYDLDAFFKSEFEVEAFRYKQIAIFEGKRGVVLAEHEAVHKKEFALTDTVEMPVNPIPEPGKMWMAATMVVQARIEELMQAPCTEMTMEEFFDRRDYNPRCQSNYRGLMNSLQEIEFDLHGYFSVEKPSLSDQIRTAAAKKDTSVKSSAPKREADIDR